MDRSTAEDVVTAVEDTYPDAFRTVVYYDVTDGDVSYETLRLRDDVAAEYDADERDRIIENVVEEAVFQQLETDWYERLHDTGPLHYSIRVFEDRIVLHFGRNPRSGGFVASIDVRTSPFVERLVEETANELE